MCILCTVYTILALAISRIPTGPRWLHQHLLRSAGRQTTGWFLGWPTNSERSLTRSNTFHASLRFVNDQCHALWSWRKMRSYGPTVLHGGKSRQESLSASLCISLHPSFTEMGLQDFSNLENAWEIFRCRGWSLPVTYQLECGNLHFRVTLHPLPATVGCCGASAGNDLRRWRWKEGCEKVGSFDFHSCSHA